MSYNKKNELRQVLGYLPQQFVLYPKISAEVLLNHFAVLKGITHKKERKELVKALLYKTNLNDVRQQYHKGKLKHLIRYLFLLLNCFGSFLALQLTLIFLWAFWYNRDLILLLVLQQKR